MESSAKDKIVATIFPIEFLPFAAVFAEFNAEPIRSYEGTYQIELTYVFIFVEETVKLDYNWTYRERLWALFRFIF